MTSPLDPMRSPVLEHKTLLWLVVLFTVAFASVLWPIAGAVLWALFLAIVFWPMHAHCKRLVRRPSLAALLTLLSIVVIVILPLTLVGVSVVQEASVLYQKVKTGDLQPGQYLQQLLDGMPAWARSILQRFGVNDIPALGRELGALLSRSSQFLTSTLLGFGQNTLNFLVSFVIMLYLLFFLLRDGTTLARQVTDAVPLPRSQTQELLSQFAAVVRATVKGNVAVALIQGGLGGLAFWYLGIPGAVLWGAFMALLSLLPAIGAALVWGPVALYKMFTGDIASGIGLVVWGTLVIGLIDNVVRPFLVGRETRLPDYVVLVTTVGGISLFGLNGFVLGPVVAAMFIACWELLRKVREAAPESAG